MSGFVDNPTLAKELGEKAGAFVKQMTGATQKILEDVQL
jgi:3-deoxy-D-manno-octulosonic-acid transferase